MADYTVSFAKHATLAASTVDKVTLQANREIIQVSNHHATDAIYVTFGAPDPVAAADDTHIVVAGTVVQYPSRTGAKEVRLISAAAAPYSVEVF